MLKTLLSGSWIPARIKWMHERCLGALGGVHEGLVIASVEKARLYSAWHVCLDTLCVCCSE